MNEEEVLDYINDRFNVDIREKNRNRETVYARAVYIKILQKCFKIRQLHIANKLNKSNGTIIHALKKTFPTLKLYEHDFYDVYLYLENELEDRFELKYSIYDIYQSIKHEQRGIFLDKVKKIAEQYSKTL